MPLVYSELRKLAGAKLRRERRVHTLQPTALVHEAYAISSAVESEAVLLLESPALSGDRLGPYRLLRQIGRGGMGAVFLDPRRRPVS